MQPRSASTHSKIMSMMRASSWSMSNVWLTASAVRYMICKLLRARASQGEVVSSVGGARISLPSDWCIVWTIREPSSSEARDDIDLVGQVLNAVFRDARVKQQRAAELQLVAAGQFVFVGLFAVDVRAVGAVQVAQHEHITLTMQLGVLARHFRIVQLHRVRRSATRSSLAIRRAESGCPDLGLGSQTAMAR